MIDEAVSTWASNRLAALGGRLTTQYAGLAELRAAGVAERRIQSLYPFDVAEWYQGIFDLTFDADMGPQPSESETQSAEQEAVLLLGAGGGVVRETANAITHTLESVTVPMRDLGTAVQDAADPEALAPTADTLRATVLLLNVLTLEGVELKHDQSRRWAKNFSSFQQLVDELLAILERHRWQSRALRSIEASRI